VGLRAGIDERDRSLEARPHEPVRLAGEGFPERLGFTGADAAEAVCGHLANPGVLVLQALRDRGRDGRVPDHLQRVERASADGPVPRGQERKKDVLQGRSTVSNEVFNALATPVLPCDLRPEGHVPVSGAEGSRDEA